MRTLCLLALALVLAAGCASAEVLGKTTGLLDARQAREAECTFGNVVADGVRSAVGADVGLVQASQFRPQTIPAGDVTREAIASALLYPDEKVVLAQLSGDKLLAALERSLSMLPDKPSTGFLQVSGVTATFRSSAPAEKRLAEVKVGNAALAEGKIYKVAMPASLAKGALGYFRVFNGLDIKEGPPIGAAVADYVTAMRTIAPQMGRLRDLSKPEG